MSCDHPDGYVCYSCNSEARSGMFWSKEANAINQANDPVKNPAHYTSDPSGIQAIQITRWRNFNIGNAIKYLWRNGLKDSEAQLQDLRKAIWYIEDEISRLESLRNG